MKKNLMCLLIIFAAAILSANVCWENGSPVYEGNFIYVSHSIKTDANNILITWVELDEGMRKIKLQKTDYAGVPLWTDPLTVDESVEFMCETGVIKSTNNCCFIDVYSEEIYGRKLYKITDTGTILWETEFDDYYNDFLPLENGGIINLRIDDVNSISYLFGIYVDDLGNVIWDDLNILELPNQSSNYDIVLKEFINNQLYVFLRCSGELYYLIFDETGNLTFQSEPYSFTNHYSGKFMNDNFYIIYNDNNESELRMWQFDLMGNSVSGDDPIILCSTGQYYFEYIFESDTYFYCLSNEYNEHLRLLKCDFNGNTLTDVTIATLSSAYIQAYDQDQDFICVSGYENNEYQNYLQTLDESGASDPIYFIPDSVYNPWFNNAYYINDGFCFIGNVYEETKSVSTLRYQDDTSELYTIREIEAEIIEPKLKKRPEGLAAYWCSGVRNSIMTQLFNEAGEPQYEKNGIVLIENENNFVLSDNVIYCYDVGYDEGFENTVSINAYDYSGNPHWSTPEQFTLTDGYHVDYGVAPFYNGYLFYTATYLENWTDRIIEINYFDENGLVWDDAVVLDVGFVNFFGSIFVKGNNLFYKDGDQVHYIKLYEDGTFEEGMILAYENNFLQIAGKEDEYFVMTRSGPPFEEKLHYFKDGNLMWINPWVIDQADYWSFTPFFEEEYLYLTGFNYPDSINVHQYDYDHNFIEENSFSFTSYNPNLQSISSYHKSEKFFFFIQSLLLGYNVQFSYTAYDEAGNQLIAEFEEVMMNRLYMENIGDIEFSGENAYLILTTGIKFMEGEYERNHYIQKIDLSDYVGAADDEINLPDLPYSIRAYPNPFNPTTTISFSIPEESQVDIAIYNLKGQKVKQLVRDRLAEGQHSIIWNGIDESEKNVASGIYFYQMNVNGKTRAVKKCLLLK
ncbi:MAG: T9SS type A sorting domain-containing protein [Candidatus Cloacimonadales bacterium]|nr:T9SS type A sorting domain-containing protein [Candidatus Cloacimonadales bacterium]